MPNILVADDSADNRRISGLILRDAGWRVEEVQSGEDAVLALCENDYALMLIDIKTPGFDSYRATEVLRAAPGRGRNVPILAFTAPHDVVAIRRTRAAGMDGHIAKPFTPEVLIDAVAPWWPAGDNAAIDRLSATFGAAEISGLLEHLAAYLNAALALPSKAAELRDEAHQLAGLAGTLGFTALSRAWLLVSETGEPALGPARIETRKALAELGRRGRFP